MFSPGFPSLSVSGCEHQRSAQLMRWYVATTPPLTDKGPDHLEIAIQELCVKQMCQSRFQVRQARTYLSEDTLQHPIQRFVVHRGRRARACDRCRSISCAATVGQAGWFTNWNPSCSARRGHTADVCLAWPRFCTHTTDAETLLSLSGNAAACCRAETEASESAIDATQTAGTSRTRQSAGLEAPHSG